MKVKDLINKGYIVYYNGIEIHSGFAIAFQLKYGFICEVFAVA